MNQRRTVSPEPPVAFIQPAPGPQLAVREGFRRRAAIYPLAPLNRSRTAFGNPEVLLEFHAGLAVLSLLLRCIDEPAGQAVGHRIIAHRSDGGDSRSALERIINLGFHDMRRQSAIDGPRSPVVDLNLRADIDGS